MFRPTVQNKYIYVNDNPVNMIDPDGQKGFSFKSVASSVKSTVSRAASTVRSVAKAVSSKASSSSIVKAGASIAASVKASASKVTAKVQQSVKKSIQTVKNLTSPKTIQQKTRAIANGVKATQKAIKTLVSGSISKAEKFAGAAKLGLLAAAKTAKGAMVKYAVPAASRVTSSVTQTVTKGVTQSVKFSKGVVLGLADAGKSTVTSLYKAGKYLATTDGEQISKDLSLQ